MHLLVVGSEDRRKALDFALEVIGALDILFAGIYCCTRLEQNRLHLPNSD